MVPSFFYHRTFGSILFVFLKMGCGKKLYSSKKNAKKAIKLLNKKANPMRKLTNAYYCPICSNYHITSMKKEKSRDLTRKIKTLNKI